MLPFRPKLGPLGALTGATQLRAFGISSCCYIKMYTTIRRELRHARKAWPDTLIDPSLLFGVINIIIWLCVYLLIKLVGKGGLRWHYNCVCVTVNHVCSACVHNRLNISAASFKWKDSRTPASCTLSDFL
jgi:hypothetical protein